jgi:hypothetical protein
MSDEDGRADGAGEQMDSELEAITQKLQSLKQRLDARQALVTTDADSDPQPEMASGDAVEMNPLTATPPRRKRRA